MLTSFEKTLSIPVLTGTERQMSWAHQIRRDFIATIAAYRNPRNELQSGMVKAALDTMLERHTDSRWWIDYRSELKLEFSVIMAEIGLGAGL